ncbi:MAG TPA: hypothetical protein VJJ83_00870, partial [Candidatus Babeliales bacterium]|nr:hypothetical protein [Candidatus Babeliales bacterium]
NGNLVNVQALLAKGADAKDLAPEAEYYVQKHKALLPVAANPITDPAGHSRYLADTNKQQIALAVLAHRTAEDLAALAASKSGEPVLAEAAVAAANHQLINLKSVTTNTVQAALAAGASANALHRSGEPYLFVLLNRNSHSIHVIMPEILALFIKAGFDLTTANSVGETALSILLASTFDYAETALLTLLAAGAPVPVELHEHPRLQRVQQRRLLAAARAGDSARLTELLEHFTFLLRQDLLDKLLNKAVAENFAAAVVDQLLQAGANPHQIDEAGQAYLAGFDVSVMPDESALNELIVAHKLYCASMACSDTAVATAAGLPTHFASDSVPRKVVQY